MWGRSGRGGGRRGVGVGGVGGGRGDVERGRGCEVWRRAVASWLQASVYGIVDPVPFPSLVLLPFQGASVTNSTQYLPHSLVGRELSDPLLTKIVRLPYSSHDPTRLQPSLWGHRRGLRRGRYTSAALHRWVVERKNAGCCHSTRSIGERGADSGKGVL